MTAIVQAISRITQTDVESEPLKAILIFSGIGLLLSLIAIQAYGLDFSAGFFQEGSLGVGTTGDALSARDRRRDACCS
jgi:hypothetical protein